MNQANNYFLFYISGSSPKKHKAVITNFRIYCVNMKHTHIRVCFSFKVKEGVCVCLSNAYLFFSCAVFSA